MKTNNNITATISTNIDDNVIKHLVFIANSQETTTSEALRWATAVGYYVQEELNKGSTLIVKTPDGELREVDIR